MDDMISGDSLSNRTISAFPLSIGTSLALESLFKPRLEPYDAKREIPNEIDINNYQEIYINLYTLYRNIVGSVNKEVFKNTNANELLSIMESEIDVINDLFSIEGNNLCMPIYYYNNYKNLFSFGQTHGIKFREDKTDYQKIYKQLFLDIIKKLFKHTDEHIEINSIIKPKNRNTSLILSHVPYDLISYMNFKKLDLLESHTGKLKHRHQWNTKYANIGDSDLSHLPFNRRLLLVLGDKILIHPNEYKLRKLIYDISIKRNWTPMTTNDKINQDFELEIKELYVLKYLQSIK